MPLPLESVYTGNYTVAWPIAVKRLVLHGIRAGPSSGQTQVAKYSVSIWSLSNYASEGTSTMRGFPIYLAGFICSAYTGAEPVGTLEMGSGRRDYWLVGPRPNQPLILFKPQVPTLPKAVSMWGVSADIAAAAKGLSMKSVSITC